MVTNGFVGCFTIPTGAPASKTWTGLGGDNNWFTATNWSGGTVPTALDNVVLDNSTVAGDYTVNIGGIQTATCRTLTIGPAVDGGTKIKVLISGIGQTVGTATQATGFGKTDFVILGSYQKPTTTSAQLAPGFRIEIDSVGATDTFKWNNANSSTAANFSYADYRAGATLVPMTGGIQPLSDGYSIQWLSTTGHTNANAWSNMYVRQNDVALLISGDQGAGDDLVARNGGILDNCANTGSGNIIENRGGNNTTKFMVGGTYLHETARGFSTPFPSILASPIPDGATTFDSGSTIQYDLESATTPYSITASNRTFGNLKFSNQYSAFRPTINYNASGGSPLTLLNDLTIGANTSFVPAMTGTFVLTGNVINNGTLNCTLGGGTGNPQFNGATTVSGTSTFTFPSGFVVNAGKTLTLANGDLTVPTGKVGTINGVVNAGAYKVVGGTSAAAVGTFAAAPGGRVNGTLKQWIGTGATTYALPCRHGFG